MSCPHPSLTRLRRMDSRTRIQASLLQQEQPLTVERLLLLVFGHRTRIIGSVVGLRKIAKLLANSGVIVMENSPCRHTLRTDVWRRQNPYALVAAMWRRMDMAKLLNEWLFAGITASTVLMSIWRLQPGHPLAVLGRTLGYGLALLCLSAAVMALCLRGRWRRDHR